MAFKDMQFLKRRLMFLALNLADWPHSQVKMGGNGEWMKMGRSEKHDKNMHSGKKLVRGCRRMEGKGDILTHDPCLFQSHVPLFPFPSLPFPSLRASLPSGLLDYILLSGQADRGNVIFANG